MFHRVRNAAIGLLLLCGSCKLACSKNVHVSSTSGTSDAGTVSTPSEPSPSPPTCHRSGEWAPLFAAPSVSIRAEWSGWGYSAVNLDLIRVGDAFTLDGSFSTKPSAPRVAAISVHEFESFLCLMSKHEFGAPPESRYRHGWTDDDPAGEIVFRPRNAAPVRAFFLDQRRQWVIAPWGEKGRMLADDPRQPQESRIEALKSHPDIDKALIRLLRGVAEPTWMPRQEDAGSPAQGTVHGAPLPEIPASLANATSLTLEDVVQGETHFDVRIELTRVAAEVFATLRFEVGSSWPADTFTTKVPPASFERWLRALDEIRAGASRRAASRDGALDEKHWKGYVGVYIVPASVVARVPGGWPVWFEWRTNVPTLRVHDDVFELPPPLAGRLRALRSEIMRAVDLDRWTRKADERGEENGWR